MPACYVLVRGHRHELLSFRHIASSQESGMSADPRPDSSLAGLTTLRKQLSMYSFSACCSYPGPSFAGLYHLSGQSSLNPRWKNCLWSGVIPNGLVDQFVYLWPMPAASSFGTSPPVLCKSNVSLHPPRNSCPTNTCGTVRWPVIF
jgi:hypothetical protein